jgi:DNA-3-methyladenine glycosylase
MIRADAFRARRTEVRRFLASRKYWAWQGAFPEVTAEFWDVFENPGLLCRLLGGSPNFQRPTPSVHEDGLEPGEAFRILAKAMATRPPESAAGEWIAPLPRSFYRPTAAVVAPRLLGHYLLRNTPEGFCGGVIVETEAYLSDDAACHAFGGETVRNQSMFGRPGHAYIYFIYGMHFCFNAVCRPAGQGEAVLVRAVEASVGPDLMRRRRPVTKPYQISSGPAKLCAALEIDRRLDGTDLCDPESPVFVARNPDRTGFLKRHGPVMTSRRVGIRKAADLPLRFYVLGSLYVSGRGPAVREKERGRGRTGSKG